MEYFILGTPLKCNTYPGLNASQSQVLLRAAVRFIAVPVGPDDLKAVLKICLRLTRTLTQAILFAELGGIKLLMALKQSSFFPGFSSLTSLLVSNMMDVSTQTNTLTEGTKDLIKDLLGFLVQLDPDEPDISEHTYCVASNTSCGNVSSQSSNYKGVLPSLGQITLNEYLDFLVQLHTAERIVTKTENIEPTTSIESRYASEKELTLFKIEVCGLLARMVKSYPGCARLITEHVYPAGISELVKEDCSALAFILDKLLMSTKDKKPATLVKMLVSALANCNHAPKIQTTLLTEVKNDLMRALSMPVYHEVPQGAGPDKYHTHHGQELTGRGWVPMSVVVESHRRTQMEQLRKKFGEYGERFRVGEYKEFNMYFENGDPTLFWMHADTKSLHDLQRYIQVSNSCHLGYSHMNNCLCRVL